MLFATFAKLRRDQLQGYGLATETCEFLHNVKFFEAAFKQDKIQSSLFLQGIILQVGCCQSVFKKIFYLC